LQFKQRKLKNKARVNKEETRAQLLRRIAELEAQNQKLKTRVIELETSMRDNGFDIELTQELYTTEKKRKKVMMMMMKKTLKIILRPKLKKLN